MIASTPPAPRTPNHLPWHLFPDLPVRARPAEQRVRTSTRHHGPTGSYAAGVDRLRRDLLARGYASIGSWGSVLSVLSLLSCASLLSIGSIASVLSIGSSGSLLSIGSAGSILSIGSAGSILSVGSAGSILSVGRAGAILNRRRQ